MSTTQKVFAALIVGCLFMTISSDAEAQSREDAMRKAYSGQNSESARRAMEGSLGQDRGRPGEKGSTSSDDQQDRGSSARSGGRRPSRSRSSSSGSSVFDTNALVAFFDGDGDGQLSLDEIDAASRLLYSLDANEDDRLTEDELAEFGGEGKAMNDAPPARNNSRSTASSSSSNRDTSRGRGLGMSAPGQPGPSAGGSSASSSRPSSRSGNRGRGLSMSSAGKPGPSVGGSSASSSSSGESDFDKFDKNSDGVIKRGELSARLRAKFSTMDSSGDREVDIDEFEDYMSDPAKNGGVVK